ncbi:MAG TPA: DUF4252 domain-containing protein [Fulvivirga sp.]|nr:DUF4252 domain-containing protein [Fulvivirga sp.]
MKKLIAVFIAMVTVSLAYGQSKAVEDFQNKYKNDRDAKVVTLNGSLFELIGNIAQFAEEDEDAQVAARIAKGITSMNLLSVPMFKTGIDLKEVESLKDRIKSEKYDELMTVRDGRERVYFMAKTGGNQIDNMLILITSDDDEFVLINIDGKLDMKDLAYMADNHKKWH